jgi:phosphonate ABC transporter permease subunit PhnE
MTLSYIIIALLIGVATLAARGSARRLVVAGALGLIVVFLTQPFAQLEGAFSRHLLKPTPMAFALDFPLLWIVPVLAVGVLVLSRGNRVQNVGVIGLLSGLVALGVAFVFSLSSERFVRVNDVPWVLEVLIPVILLAVAFAVSRGFTESRLQLVTIIAGAVVAITVAWYLFSPAGAVTFDALRGYYKVVGTPTQADLALVVKNWNETLELTNQERARINTDWARAGKTLDAFESALSNAQAAERSAGAKGPQALEVARNALREAERGMQGAREKIEQIRVQRLEFGVSDAASSLEPLSTIQDASELPRGYKPEREASDAGVRRVFPNHPAYGFGAWLLFGIFLTVGGAGLLVRREAALEEADLASGTVLAVVIAVLAFGFNAVEFDLGRFVRGWPFIQDFGRRSVPADWNGILSDVLKALAITVATAMIGTVLAASLALPASLLAARNLTQRSLVGRVLYVLTRVFFNVDRGVDTLILALVFVAAVGLGPLAGVLAMAIHSMADLGKLYSEAIENADKGPLEALEAAGAPGTSVVRWAVLPQVLPLFVSYTLYRFEINFRVSIILGFVGAGGVGFLIQETMRSGKYNQMIVAVLAVVVMVNVLDFISASVRRRIIG